VTKIAILVKPIQAKTGSVRFEGEANRSTPLTSTGRSHIFFANQTTNFIVSYKYSQFMLRLNSINQIVSMYFYDNKKQTTFVNSSCHFKPNVNHLGSTSTYTSYFLLLLFVTKYYKLAVYVGGDSVKSDQTYITESDLGLGKSWSI
jgi:hypothetical protein